MPKRKDILDEDNRGADEIQENLRIAQAYKKGKDRHAAYQDDPTKPGGPEQDGYGNMSAREREAYKRGHRGD